MNCLAPPISMSHHPLKPPISSSHHRLRVNSTAASASTASAGAFDAVKETFSVDVIRAEGRPLNVPLIAPFTIASSHLDAVGNVAVRVELRGGGVGWGEAPVLPSVTAEDQPAALEAIAVACGFLLRRPPMALGTLLDEISCLLPGHDFASARAGIEMALVDAVANSLHIPLWKLFGGASTSIATDITIPIVAPVEAAKLAAEYKELGFNTLKLKVGKNLSSDIEVLRAIKLVHSHCSFILDANEGYTANEAIEVLEKLNGMGVKPVLFEQPVHRDNWEGLSLVSRVAKEKYGVSVAADESCRSLEDAERIIRGNIAHVINIKLAKLGVLGALDVIEAAGSSGTELMIGGMVETRLAMGFAGHLAAGFGCFKQYIPTRSPLILRTVINLVGLEIESYIQQNGRSGYGARHVDLLKAKGLPGGVLDGVFLRMRTLQCTTTLGWLGFDTLYIDLDTPLLLLNDPIIGGYEASGAVYKFDNSGGGQGGFLDWDNTSS